MVRLLMSNFTSCKWAKICQKWLITHTSTPLSCQLIDGQLTFLHPWPACTHQLRANNFLYTPPPCTGWRGVYIIYKTKLSKYKYLLIILIYMYIPPPCAGWRVHPVQGGGVCRKLFALNWWVQAGQGWRNVNWPSSNWQDRGGGGLCN